MEQKVGQGLEGSKKDVRVGPWGGSGGSHSYVFKPDGTITDIYITSGDCIDSIKFGFIDAQTGHEYESKKFGGDGGNLSKMTIEEGEVIVEVSGTFALLYNKIVVTSLSFKTNKKKATFGSVNGTNFSLPVDTTTGQFAGFYGRYGDFLDSIGAILTPM